MTAIEPRQDHVEGHPLATPETAVAAVAVATTTAPPPRTPVIGAALRLVNDRRIRYLGVGGVAAAVFYGTFAGTWLFAQGRVPYLLIVVMSSIITALTTYPLYRFFVFATPVAWVSGFLRFYLVSLWGLGFNFAALPFLVEIVGIHVLISQAIVICAGPLINYQLHRHWTFKKAKA